MNSNTTNTDTTTATDIKMKQKYDETIKNAIQDINKVIKLLKIDTSDPSRKSARESIVSILTVYVQNNRNRLIFDVLNEVAVQMVSDIIAKPTVLYEGVEVEVPNFIVLFQDYISNEIKKLQELQNFTHLHSFLKFNLN